MIDQVVMKADEAQDLRSTGWRPRETGGGVNASKGLRTGGLRAGDWCPSPSQAGGVSSSSPYLLVLFRSTASWAGAPSPWEGRLLH